MIYGVDRLDKLLLIAIPVFALVLVSCVSEDRFHASIVKANAFSEAARNEDAAREWLAATKIRNDYVQGYVNAADELQKAGRFEASLDVLASIPTTLEPEVLLLEGNALFRVGSYEQAIERWKFLAWQHPESPENIERLRYAEKARDEWTAAVDQFIVEEQTAGRPIERKLASAALHAQRGETRAASLDVQKAIKNGISIAVVQAEPRLGEVRKNLHRTTERPFVKTRVGPASYIYWTGLGLVTVAVDTWLESLGQLEMPDSEVRKAVLMREAWINALCDAGDYLCDGIRPAADEIKTQFTAAELTRLSPGWELTFNQLGLGGTARVRLSGAVNRLNMELMFVEE